MDSIVLYQLLALFFIYAFLGWCSEVSYHALITGTFVNRGFLSGPICPIYGIGIVGVVFLLEAVKTNTLLLFFASLILTTFLEFLTGFLLEKLFHARWWDYTGEPFHFGPYICLKFSLIWGFACVFVVKLLHPFILLCIGVIPLFLGKVILALFSAALVADLYVTITTVTNIFLRLERLERLSSEIQMISDRIGERISDSTLEVIARERQGKELLEDYKDALDKRLEESIELLTQRLEDHMAEFHQKISENSLGHRRILKAFPKLLPWKHRGFLDAIREANHKRKQ
ncbi:MAG: hypothetical protein K0S60_742 [Evtepia sp.]|jgi:uncharacterized membrane protein|nr:hypothetical protein [Evtepia sp.]